jgi:imidazolonepropionase-like amidohydrolase
MKTSQSWLFAAWASAALLSSHVAAAQEVLIRGATVHTASTKGVLKNTDVLIRAGLVAGIGTSLPAPAGGTVIDAKGRDLTPGMFGGLSTIGADEIGGESSTVDSSLNLKSPAWDQQWRPEFDVTLSFNPHSVAIPVTRIEGITWAVLSPGSGDSIMAGQGAAVTLDGRYDAVLRGSHTLFLQMGNSGARASGGTRAAELMLLDQAIRETHAAGAPAAGALLHAAGRETLARYLAGGRVVFNVDRAADILQVIAFAQRNNLKAIIVGGDEAWEVAKELARADVPVILDPLDDLPADFDHLGSTLDNAARLHKAGVRIAFSGQETPNGRLTRQLAGNAVAHGLPPDAALAAITSTPADIFGLGATRGHVAVGQVADLVLWSGDPLEVTSLADQVWIAGRAIDMRSRQTELRDRYWEKLKGHQAR